MKKFAVAVALALVILPGCSVFDRDKRESQPGAEQVKPRDMTATRIVEAYTGITATAELVNLAAKQGSISKVQAQKASQLLKVALAAVDKSLDLWVSGDKSKSANALEAALAAAAEARSQMEVATSKGGK